MARDYLAIPATSVPSERCFSIASGLLTKQRGKMAEGMANTIMCCKYWLGFDEYTPEELALEQEGLQDQDHEEEAEDNDCE